MPCDSLVAAVPGLAFFTHLLLREKRKLCYHDSIIRDTARN